MKIHTLLRKLCWRKSIIRFANIAVCQLMSSKLFWFWSQAISKFTMSGKLGYANSKVCFLRVKGLVIHAFGFIQKGCHLAHSLALKPSDFHLKHHLAGKWFETDEVVVLRTLLKTAVLEFYNKGINSLVPWLTNCTDCKGDLVEK